MVWPPLNLCLKIIEGVSDHLERKQNEGRDVCSLGSRAHHLLIARLLSDAFIGV